MKKITKNVYYLGDHGCCVYLIDTQSDDGLVLIDSGTDINFIKSIEKERVISKNLKHCFITHGHFDHFNLCAELKKLYPDLNIYAHDLDSDKIEKEGMGECNAAKFSRVDYLPVKLTHRIKETIQFFKLGNYQFQCIHCPGHTSGSTIIYLKVNSSKIVFCGDACYSPLRVFYGNIYDYNNSMRKLLKLNANILCDGHFGVIKSAEDIKNHVEGYKKAMNYQHIVFELDPLDYDVWYKLTKQYYLLKNYADALETCNYLLEIDPNNKKAQKLQKDILQYNPSKQNYIKDILKLSFGENF